MIKIALEAMGSDHAPFSEVAGAVEAVREYDCGIILVGQQDVLEAELAKHKYPTDKIEVRHASEVIEMHDSPAASVRKKKDASVSVAVKLIKEGAAQAIVTAGNTGAAVCAAGLFLRMIEGVDRPGIGVLLPTLKDVSMLIDAGANVDPKPEHLLQYGVMASGYFKFILKKENPRIGLLNVGQEESKGSDFALRTHELFNKTELNFIGNVEGHDVYNGECDIIVCGGLVGNVALKISESLGSAISSILRREMKKSLITRLGALLSASAFRALKKEIDYAEYGGAPLLGVDGNCIIAHGGSSPKAIKNAIREALKMAKSNVNEYIEKALKEFQY